MIQDRPILGHGLGTYAVAFSPYGRAVGTAVVNQAHNDYLQLLAEMGVFGAILCIAFIGLLARSAWVGLSRRDHLARAVAAGVTAGLFALMLHELVDFNLQIPSNALALLLSSALVVRAASASSRPGAAGRLSQ